jgi:hypothetical protein
MTLHPLPLFAQPPLPNLALPHARATLEGYAYDDDVLLHDERNPGQWRKARVIAVLPRLHTLTLRVGFSIVSLQMPQFRHKLKRAV